MKNYGFNVALNGEKIAKAGFSNENYVASCSLVSVHRRDGSEELFGAL